MRTTFLLLSSTGLFASLPAQHWVPINGVPQRVDTALAYDSARGQTVLFGGAQALTMFSTEPLLAHGDTWIHDAAGWRQLRPAVSPAPRAHHAMAYDAARQRTVLFGGLAETPGTYTGTFVDDTWEFDGTTWQLRPTSHRPPAALVQQMAYDPARARVVLYSASANETWEYDGVDWQLRHPAVRPPASVYGALTFSAGMQKVVLCGRQYQSSGTPFVTWSYDGATWTQLVTVHTPSTNNPVGFTIADDGAGGILLQTNDPQGQHATWRCDGIDWLAVPAPQQPAGQHLGHLTLDAARGRHLLYTGAATWDFDGATWTPTDMRLLPEQRSIALPLADRARNRLLLFGGYRNGVGATSELLALGPQGWQPLPAANPPPPRIGPLVALDTRRDRIVLHGGYLNATPTTDTWEFDGTTWTRIVTTTTPWPELTAMTYDPVRSHCVAYGSLVTTSTSFSNTWFFDGVDWRAATPPHSPPPRIRPVLAYDATHDVVAMYGGGISNSYTVRTDTWWLQDGDWRQQNPQQRPPVAFTIGAHDPVRGRLVVATGTTLGTTDPGAWYEYDGQLWWPLPVATGPSINQQDRFVLQEDPASGRLLAIGMWGDVWAYEPVPLATFAALGAGCAQGPAPRLDRAANSLPHLGSSFTVQVTDLPAAPGALYLAYGFGFQSFQGRALPQELGWLGLPGCLLWIEPAGLGALVVHAGNTASHSIALPPAPALAGTRFLLQALPFDPLAPAGLGPPSNAGIATAH